LVEAGASPATAGRASEELANYNSEFTAIREDMRAGFVKVDQDMRDGFAKVDARFARVDQEFEKVSGDINLLRWMMGTNLVLTVGVLFRLLTH
jgi:archaellum component FlaC